MSTGSITMAVYQVLYWRDIPAQVRVYGDRTGGRRPLSRQMPDWFQQEIDRVAMRDGLTGTDAYLDEWQWSGKQEWPGEEEEVESVAEAVLKQLEDGYERG
ncbi:MAG: virulence factor [Gemmatimonadetes bacterium]|nr:virulence factor [Gemmatimonadota bacterium]